MAIGKLFREGLPFNNVVNSGVATAEITPGRTLECILLELGGTFTKAMITQLRLKANGKVIFEATGTQIDKLNAFRGLATDAAYLPIFFVETKGRDRVDQMVGAFDTSVGIKNISIEVTIAGATSPTLKMYLQESKPQTDKNGDPLSYMPVMSKVLRYPFSIGNGGKLPITLPFGNTGAVLKRLHVEYAGTAGNVKSAVLKQDGLIVHESGNASNNFMNTVFGRSNQTKLYSLDFGIDDNSMNLLDTRDARSLEFLLDLTAGDNGTVIAEYLDTLGNL